MYWLKYAISCEYIEAYVLGLRSSNANNNNNNKKVKTHVTPSNKRQTRGNCTVRNESKTYKV
ncbi:MAG: hypothetical protein ACTHKP_05900 [Nitrososphaeraceae archaeon]